MRKFILVLAITLIAVPVSAQRLNLDFLSDLEDRAEEVVDVTLDASMLRIASRFLGKEPDEKAIREIVQGLQGIYVRSYEFASDNEYDRGLVNRLRSQLGPTWKPLVSVRSKTKENVNIYADMRGEQITGLVVISAEPRELTVVNIVGPIDIDKLAALQGEFGIPEWEKENDRD